MKIHIFTGPTLDKKTILENLRSAIIHPPVARDDLFNISFSEGDKVLIIDGYFETRPSVAHFEIIDLIENGVAVFGASSMGALRAAELQDIGMVGIGKIFEMYFSQQIDGDDEVALLHSEDFVPLSVPLIDLRILLQTLVQQEQIRPEISEKIISSLGEYAYQERSWSLLKKIISQHTKEQEQKCIFENFTPENSQKRKDALLALELVQKPSRFFPLSLPKTCYRLNAKNRILKTS